MRILLGCYYSNFIREILMPINIVQSRVEIGGVFDALCDVRYATKFSRSSHSPSIKATVTGLIFTLFLLFMSDDIELNSGLNKTNWLLEAFNTVNKFDIIYVFESYMDSTFSSDNEDIIIKGYKLVRADHPNNKKGVVIVYILENLCQFCYCLVFIKVNV